VCVTEQTGHSPFFDHPKYRMQSSLLPAQLSVREFFSPQRESFPVFTADASSCSLRSNSSTGKGGKKVAKVYGKHFLNDMQKSIAKRFNALKQQSGF
jgi:hypothetical protein